MITDDQARAVAEGIVGGSDEGGFIVASKRIDSALCGSAVADGVMACLATAVFQIAAAHRLTDADADLVVLQAMLVKTRRVLA